MTLNNETIDNFIKILKEENKKMDNELSSALNKKERSAVLRRHKQIDNISKVLYSLRHYDDDGSE